MSRNASAFKSLGGEGGRQLLLLPQARDGIAEVHHRVLQAALPAQHLARVFQLPLDVPGQDAHNRVPLVQVIDQPCATGRRDQGRDGGGSRRWKGKGTSV